MLLKTQTRALCWKAEVVLFRLAMPGSLANGYLGQSMYSWRSSNPTRRSQGCINENITPAKYGRKTLEFKIFSVYFYVLYTMYTRYLRLYTDSSARVCKLTQLLVGGIFCRKPIECISNTWLDFSNIQILCRFCFFKFTHASLCFVSVILFSLV